MLAVIAAPGWGRYGVWEQRASMCSLHAVVVVVIRTVQLMHCLTAVIVCNHLLDTITSSDHRTSPADCTHSTEPGKGTTI